MVQTRGLQTTARGHTGHSHPYGLPGDTESWPYEIGPLRVFDKKFGDPWLRRMQCLTWRQKAVAPNESRHSKALGVKDSLNSGVVNLFRMATLFS